VLSLLLARVVPCLLADCRLLKNNGNIHIYGGFLRSLGMARRKAGFIEKQADKMCQAK
jgi:hypothetical protein